MVAASGRRLTLRQKRLVWTAGGRREGRREEGLRGQTPSLAYLGQKDWPAPPQTTPPPTPAPQLPTPSAALLGPSPHPSPLEQKPPSGLVYGRKVNKSFHFGLLPCV